MTSRQEPTRARRVPAAAWRHHRRTSAAPAPSTRRGRRSAGNRARRSRKVRHGADRAGRDADRRSQRSKAQPEIHDAIEAGFQGQQQGRRLGMQSLFQRVDHSGGPLWRVSTAQLRSHPFQCRKCTRLGAGFVVSLRGRRGRIRSLRARRLSEIDVSAAV